MTRDDRAARDAELTERLAQFCIATPEAELADAAARFGAVTADDAALILMLRPDASDVDSYAGWMRRGRRVRHGEKGMPMLAKRDPNGRQLYLFDITQTHSWTEEAKPEAPLLSAEELDAAVAPMPVERMEGAPEMPLPLVTSRYQSWAAGMAGAFVPIRITVGHPRFVRYQLERAMALAPHELFPGGRYREQPADVEQLIYSRRMERFAQTILAELREVARKHPGKTGVLMCYEDVWKGEICHRRWAAAWFAARYGWVVPELDGQATLV